MSDTLPDLASWLPSDFLSGDMDDKPLFHNPHRLPYDFASSSSTESESDNDDEFPGLTQFPGLTHRFTRSVSLQERLKIPYPAEKKRVFSGSPESTLNWNVSGPTHVRSSPTTPFCPADEDAWDLIYAAAEQISRMKSNNLVNNGGFGNRGLLGAPRLLGHPLSHRNTQNEVLFLRQQQLRERVVACGGYHGRFVAGRPVGFGLPAWPPVENQRRQTPADGFVLKPVSGGSSGGCGSGFPSVKKGCAGTGVFLPRNYSNIPPESKKKPVCSAANPPARVAQSFNIIPQPQTNIHGVFSRQHQAAPLAHHHDELAEMIQAHRQNAVILAQQRRNNNRSHESEVVLPQEWTY